MGRILALLLMAPALVVRGDVAAPTLALPSSETDRCALVQAILEGELLASAPQEIDCLFARKRVSAPLLEKRCHGRHLDALPPFRFPRDQVATELEVEAAPGGYRYGFRVTIPNPKPMEAFGVGNLCAVEPPHGLALPKGNAYELTTSQTMYRRMMKRR